MNYNAKYGGGPPGLNRKVKRVSDVNAMGPIAPTAQPYVPNAFNAPPEPAYTSNIDTNYGVDSGQQRNIGFNYAPTPQYDPYNNPAGPNLSSYGGLQQPQQPQQPQPQPQFSTPSVPMNPILPQNPGVPNQFGMFQQPIVQDMALQYGQKLADHGKQIVESQFEKYVPVTSLKYYFAVDNGYVINKLRLLFFPFTHKDWSLKYNEDSPVQPRYDLNAPDLYIPTMAYITYVVLAGLVLGMQNQFTPEQLGIVSSSALAYSIFEIIIYSITLYVSNIPTTLKTLDLLAFSGYKFAVIVMVILVSIIFKRVGYFSALIYSSITLCFFLVSVIIILITVAQMHSKLRTLKAKILRDTTSATTYDAYGNVQPSSDQYDYTIGRKRKLYFLFLFAGLQPILSFWLSMHLIPSRTIDAVLSSS